MFDKFKHIFRRKTKALILVFVCAFVISGSVLVSCNQKEAQAFCTPCVTCFPLDPPLAVALMEALQEYFWTPLIEGNINDHLNSEYNWIVEDFYELWFHAMGELTQFLSSTGMVQAEIVGMFFDSKNILETHRLYFKLHAEAHRDYHPSDDFCWFGTVSRSLAGSDNQARLNLLALSEASISRQLGYISSSAAISTGDDKKNRWFQFIDTFCDPKDNDWFRDSSGTSYRSGLDFACDHDGSESTTATGATDRSRVNKDIDYTAVIDEPRTINVNFLNQSTLNPPPILTDAEEEILAMSANLYGNRVPTRALSKAIFESEATAEEALSLYMDLRSVVAKRNVAQNTFNTIVSMKAEGSNGSLDPLATEHPEVGRYIGAIMRELMPTGTPDAEIIQIMGENPSYYAQLEVMAKKIYQNPEFFANLYDKPANVARKEVAMKAIDLMLDRALLESELRQEMLLSVMLSSELKKRYRNINSKFATGGSRYQDGLIIE